MAKTPRPTLRLVDRAVLLGAWLVTCGVVYGLGFYLGRAAPDRRAGAEQRTVRLPVTTTPPPEGPAPREAREFPSFYETLPAGERPAASAPASAHAVATTTLPTVARAPIPPKPVATTVTTSPARPVTTVAPVPPSRATTATITQRSAVTTTATVPSSPPTTLAPARSGDRWTVEASPTRNRSEAESLRATLRQRGYDVVLVQVKRDGDTWYRLRVGRYATLGQANEVMRRLRDNEGVTHAFVASE